MKGIVLGVVAYAASVVAMPLAHAVPNKAGPWFVNLDFYAMLNDKPADTADGQEAFGFGRLGFTTQAECDTWADRLRIVMSQRGTKFYILAECKQRTAQ